ncbi:MAG: tryptophan 7-halogenase [Rhodospirillales bacterium]|nr:tryptophan 7-halogenase [Rhodospirillales bacterium]
MIEFAAQALGELFPYWSRQDQNAADRFNTCSAGLFEEVLEFVNLHYVTSTRRDTPFWRAATDPDAVAPSLAGKLELWRRKRPTDLDFTRNQRLFSLESYEYLLFGMGLSGSIARTKGTPPPSILAPLQKCLAKLPTHEQWLSSLDGEKYLDEDAIPTAADI